MNRQYDHTTIEAKWREIWERLQINSIQLSSAKKPFYNLMMFPYPSAEGLHVGNMYAFTGSDIYGRFKRMEGYDVFEPIGLDGFGIHSENYAMKIGRHPFEHANITEKNYYNQLKSIGAMFDWQRTIETYKSDYYRWTQWLFITLFKAGLVYRSSALVNWCNSCKTVLADEQVIDELCERCRNKVEKKTLVQWFFKITAYAEALHNNIEALEWSKKVKHAQINWIGKKTGVDITYNVVDAAGKILGEVVCFTTRPETNYGATFVALSPEHSFINHILKLLSKEKIDLIVSYIESVNNNLNSERGNTEKAKTGVDTGLYCVNNLSGERMPLYISDFVLTTVGTGAVVGVPGHDVRDYEFAQAFNLPVKRVVKNGDDNGAIATIADVYEGEGEVIHSGEFSGKSTALAKTEITDYLERKGWGKGRTHYHLRDWIISRQRFWGPPIPMIFCQACANTQQHWHSHKDSVKEKTNSSNSQSTLKQSVEHLEGLYGWYPVSEDQLPVELPYIEDFRPGEDGVPPLQKHKEFYETTCPGCGGPAVRSTEVSDTFLDSSWYFLRYPSLLLTGKQSFSEKTQKEIDRIMSTSKEASQVPDIQLPFEPKITAQWLPVDMYTGGAEHSVLHLLYSRFITHALSDLGYITFQEPFTRFFAHGLVIKDGAKMSKSKGNVVNPDEYIKSYGSDALRLYLMFIGPYSDGGNFRDSAMEGMYKWVGRVYRFATTVISAHQVTTAPNIVKALHRLIKKVGEDIERRHYNTAIAAMMEFTHLVLDSDINISIDNLRIFLKLLAPLAPSLTEELYQASYGRKDIDTTVDSIHLQPWPEYDPKNLDEEDITVVVQINGKLRGSVTLTAEMAADEAAVRSAAESLQQVQEYLKNGVKKVIFVSKKIINYVV